MFIEISDWHEIWYFKIFFFYKAYLIKMVYILKITTIRKLYKYVYIDINILNAKVF